MLQITAKSLLTGLGVCLWVAGSMAALIYDANRRLIEFDPDGALLYASMSGNFDQAIKTAFSQFRGDLTNQVFHIQAQDCSCNLANNRHVAEIDEQISRLGLQSHKINAASLVTANLPLSAFPAVVAFNGQGELAYLGPYSSGLFCAGGNRLLDKYLPGLSEAAEFPIVITDSQGCYCKPVVQGS